MFSSMGDGRWVCFSFTAFDIHIKSRFTEKYRGKLIENHYLYIEHKEDTWELWIDAPHRLSHSKQFDLIESFFSIYFDSLKEIGYETLDPEPQ